MRRDPRKDAGGEIQRPDVASTEPWVGLLDGEPGLIRAQAQVVIHAGLANRSLLRAIAAIPGELRFIWMDGAIDENSVFGSREKVLEVICAVQLLGHLEWLACQTEFLHIEGLGHQRVLPAIEQKAGRHILRVRSDR